MQSQNSNYFQKVERKGQELEVMIKRNFSII